MANCDRDKLQGTVAIDEAPITAEGSKLAFCKAYLAVELVDAIPQRICMNYSLCFNQRLFDFIKSNIQPNSTIKISGINTYVKLPNNYKFEVRHKKSGSNLLPPFYNVILYLRENQLLGTRQNICTTENRDLYLCECCFKFNRRNENAGGLFYEILRSAVQTNIKQIK